MERHGCASSTRNLWRSLIRRRYLLKRAESCGKEGNAPRGPFGSLNSRAAEAEIALVRVLPQETIGAVQPRRCVVMASHRVDHDRRPLREKPGGGASDQVRGKFS